MPRPRERVCLQNGLKLDLNRLARQGSFGAAQYRLAWYSVDAFVLGRNCHRHH